MDVTVTGVITLEDVIEEIINDEIVDESDRYLDNTQRQRPNRTDRSDGTDFLKLFGHKLRKHKRLSREEISAVCAFLKAMMPEFADFADSPLTALVQRSEVVEIDLPERATSSIDLDASLSAASDALSYEERIIYRQGVPNETFSVILQGHLAIQAGTEKFPSNVGPWSVLGPLSLRSKRMHRGMCFRSDGTEERVLRSRFQRHCYQQLPDSADTKR